MKKIILILFISVTAFVACKKEVKPYDGVAQVAFAEIAYTYKIAKDTTIKIPVTLITANNSTTAFTASVAADSSAVGTIVKATDFPATLNMGGGKYADSVAVNASFAGFGATNKQVLRLKLSCNSNKVAANYQTSIITITK